LQAVPRSQDGGVADAQVGRPFLDGAHDLRRQMLLQVDLDLGVVVDEAAQVFRQELHHGRNAGMDSDMSAHAVGVFAEFTPHLLQAEQDRSGMVQQAFAGRGQVDSPGVPVEQRGVQREFQIGQPLAHGRGCDEFALCRLPDAPELAHSDKQLQRGEVDPAGEGAFGGFQGSGSKSSRTAMRHRHFAIRLGQWSSRSEMSGLPEGQ
jgi:hypothetical protein